MNEPPKPSQIFAKRMRAVRTRRKWSLSELSERLAELGVKLNASQLAKIENGVRAISLDRAISIAVALGVSPLNLFVPLEKEQYVSLAPNVPHLSTIARAWVRGISSLSTDQKDEGLFRTEAPKTEIRARANPRIQHLEAICFALLETGDLKAVEEWLPEGQPKVSEMVEAVKPLIEKGRAERMEHLAEWALDDAEVLARVAAAHDPDLLGRVVAQLREIQKAQEGAAE